MTISMQVAMNFILFVKCTEQQDFRYSNPFYERLKSQHPTADFLDLDNFSDSELIGHACKAIELSEKSCIIFDMEPGANTQSLMKLATLIADRPMKCRVFRTGKDERISKLLFAQTDFSYHNLSEAEQAMLIKTFLNGND